MSIKKGMKVYGKGRTEVLRTRNKVFNHFIWTDTKAANVDYSFKKKKITRSAVRAQPL